jgi:hypothetical protein
MAPGGELGEDYLSIKKVNRDKKQFESESKAELLEKAPFKFQPRIKSYFSPTDARGRASTQLEQKNSTLSIPRMVAL